MFEGISPFLPNTRIQYAWDSTSLSWLKECPRKYFYHMIEGYVGKGESVHLRFGQLIHSALEFYDRQRADCINHEDALRATLTESLKSTWDGDKPWSPDHPSKTRETLIRTVIWYLDQFKDDPAQTVILANGKPAVELSFRLELDWGPLAPEAQSEESTTNGTFINQPYILCGHLDRLVSFQDQFFVMDRKTTSATISQSFFDQFDPDNQMTLYSFAAKVIYNTPVRGVILDGMQIAVGFSRFVRGFTFRTEPQIEEWLNDLRYWFRQAEGFAEANYWPQNDKSCHKYGGCTFRKVCSKDPQVRQIFLDSDFVRREWNPLVPR